MEEHRQVDPLPSRIASLVHAHFNALPSRSKPIVHPDGSREWIPMTGIVVVKGMLNDFFLSELAFSFLSFCLRFVDSVGL